jgi:hypothetical protein
MKPHSHSVTTPAVASIVALSLLATPVAIHWNTFAIHGAHAVAKNLGDVADSVSDSLGDAAHSVGDSLGDAAHSVGETVGNAADHVGDTVGNTADHVGDAVGNAAEHVSDTVGDAADHLSESNSVGNTADHVSDTVENAADHVADSVDTGVTVTVREFKNIRWKRVGDSIEDTVDDVANSVDNGVTVIVREVTQIGSNAGRGSREAGEQHPRSLPSTTVAAIEPSADLGRPDCASEQGAETSCLLASYEAEPQKRQLMNAPSGGRTYLLQRVEARRYSNRGVIVLVVQGLVSNMSNQERSVPPLLAIVRDDHGKEVMRWTFRTNADSLAPGASSGFRSEISDPQSKSAKVTIVIAPEQRTMR